MALGCRAVTKIPSPWGAGGLWAGLLSQASFGGSERSWGGSLLVLCPGNTWASLMLHPSPVLLLLGCDTFAFWPSVRALVGLETLKMATAFWWEINFGFLENEGPGDLGRIVSQVLCEQRTLSYEQTGMCRAAGGCASSPLHGYMIIWIFQLGTGSQGPGKGVAGLSSCHHAGAEEQRSCWRHSESTGEARNC